MVSAVFLFSLSVFSRIRVGCLILSHSLQSELAAMGRAIIVCNFLHTIKVPHSRVNLGNLPFLFFS